MDSYHKRDLGRTSINTIDGGGQEKKDVEIVTPLIVYGTKDLFVHRVRIHPN